MLKSQDSCIRIAIQKSGRLSKDSKDLLAFCGVRFRFRHNQLISFAENMSINIIRVRDDDIPGLIMDKIVDLGIVGGNVLKEEVLKRKSKEESFQYDLLKKLDFGKCRLSLCVPVNSLYKNINFLNNSKIATSYPYLLKNYLDKRGIKFQSYILNGSVEIAIHSGLSNAICDLVSTGVTLKENGLREVQSIYLSQACLISRTNINCILKRNTISKLLTRINGVIKAKESKYIMLHVSKNKLKKVMQLLRGAERPTVLKLAGNSNRVALHMVSAENLFWETMEKLKSLGASSILVLPIEKMME